MLTRARTHMYTNTRARTHTHTHSRTHTHTHGDCHFAHALQFPLLCTPARAAPPQCPTRRSSARLRLAALPSVLAMPMHAQQRRSRGIAAPMNDGGARRRAAPAGRERWPSPSRCCWYAPARPLHLRPPPSRLEGHSTGYSSGYCRGCAVCPCLPFQPPPHPDHSQPPLARIALPATLGCGALRHAAATNRPAHQHQSSVRAAVQAQLRLEVDDVCIAVNRVCRSSDLAAAIVRRRLSRRCPSCCRWGTCWGAGGYHLSTREHRLAGLRRCPPSGAHDERAGGGSVKCGGCNTLARMVLAGAVGPPGAFAHAG
jgi:hypothetical protein